MFRKSSFSFAMQNCVEADAVPAFRKSSFSQGASNCAEIGFRKPERSMNDGNCAEVGTDTEVLVRDTKEDGAQDRVTLRFSRAAWERFTGELKRG